MANLKNERLRKSVPLRRKIADYSSGEDGPLVIAIGGIHGNEPAGVFAIHLIQERLRKHDLQIKGRFLGIAGNLKALESNTRFIDEDLNRLFLEDRIKKIRHTKEPKNTEEQELLQIVRLLEREIQEEQEVFFVDCHTTSSETAPYISVNEYERSIKLADTFPLASVIGLERSIPGCSAEYLNKIGLHGFTVEGGQHEDFSSIENLEALIWMLLCQTGAIERKAGAHCFPHHYQLLSKNIIEGKKVYHLVQHYRIREDEDFSMKPGYINFEKVEKGEWLASNQREKIHAEYDGRILMPLYQSQGNDGFFLLQEGLPSYHQEVDKKQVEAEAGEKV